MCARVCACVQVLMLSGPEGETTAGVARKAVQHGWSSWDPTNPNVKKCATCPALPGRLGWLGLGAKSSCVPSPCFLLSVNPTCRRPRVAPHLIV